MARSPYGAPVATALGLGQLWLEASTVMTLRLWMLGWNLAPHDEAQRMVDEKLPAYTDAAFSAWRAAARASLLAPFDPARATAASADAWTRLLTRKTRSNRRRLTRLPRV